MMIRATILITIFIAGCNPTPPEPTHHAPPPLAPSQQPRQLDSELYADACPPILTLEDEDRFWAEKLKEAHALNEHFQHLQKKNEEQLLKTRIKLDVVSARQQITMLKESAKRGRISYIEAGAKIDELETWITEAETTVEGR